MERPLKLGISACLLGEKVRYDGGHKLDEYLIETIGPFVAWVPVCPEVETGLGIPREPMRLVGPASEARLVTLQTRIDQTDRLLEWARERLRELSRKNLCGYVFKSNSPSCGTQVEIHNEQEDMDDVGPGIWAGAFMAANQILPVETEIRLRDSAIRENFLERVLAFNR
ncbi:MAG: 2-thiouracil desulfurase family protein [Thermoleophilia bacterium]